jgi:16S rRNA C1402 (ribose-2'-O) methylase RsmI
VLAGLVGAAAAVGNLGSLGVFRHGVVVSVLPGAASRAVCALAVAAGVAAAVTVFAGHEASS